MDNANFYALIASNFPGDKDAACLIGPEGAQLLAYSELDRRSAEFAGLLAELGLGCGDRVLVQVEKSPEAILLYLACLRLGIIYVPLNTAYTASEVDFFLTDAEPGLLVCRPDDEAEFTQGSSVVVLSLGSDGSGTLMTRASGAQPETRVAMMKESDVADILYTSGTTGRPKGAMLTHGNLASNVHALTDAWGWRRDDVLLHALPIYHAHGLFVGVHLSLFNGTAMIFLPKFTADDVIACLPKATVFMGVPTFYTRLLGSDDFTREACANMRLFISGSAPLLEDTFDEFEARTGLTILERYGMTEALMITSNPLDDKRVAGSVGKPLADICVRVVDEDGEPVPAGEVGQLEISGPNVFQGYWRQTEKTAQEFTDDGFFRTGDLARLSEFGHVSLAGRSKDLIISGGLNIYPKEVENAIDQHDSIAESAVIGIPHADFGEAVVAVVVLDATSEFDEQDLAGFLATRLANFKRPKQYVTVNELPRNALGKVQKNLLREQYANCLAT